MPLLVLSLISFVLVVLKALGPLALVPLWVCLLPLVPLGLALVLVFVAAILALVVGIKVALKTPIAVPTA
ncbi:putative membrane protein [Pseudarthrobacter siccitolerans]|uniref:Putative membrane protein n=1 Tax=Pseudarthrobacter siccitolerans TaxID=861266 RepID=A0A024GYT8_9MICC|nr:hypothetical protein [Pseudarthrobacter siccitolerans]CCQ44646.1 putative membrane protein [Pseudarthrobacter siccitolerans]